VLGVAVGGWVPLGGGGGGGGIGLCRGCRLGGRGGGEREEEGDGFANHEMFLVRDVWEKRRRWRGIAEE
jgi:hypothetical protein